MTSQPFVRFVLGALVATLVPPENRAVAQCAQWLPSDPIAGVSGTIRCLTHWDPDGTGPLQPVIVAGGTFSAAGGVLAQNIAVFDPSTGTWLPLGPGLGAGSYDCVRALATLPNGELVAGGSFTNAGPVAVNNLARWNGTAWAPLGSGTNKSVHCLTAMPNGDLIAGGSFTIAGGVPADHIARWDGAAWFSTGLVMASPHPDFMVSAAAVLPSGDLVIGGAFALAGGTTAPNVARWNGITWSTMASGVGIIGHIVTSATTMPNGDVVVGGTFSAAGGVPALGVARWNGASWSPLGSGVSNVQTVTVMPNGDIVVGGIFGFAGGAPAYGAARWNGTAWMGMQVLPSSIQIYASLLLPNGDLIVGGWFLAASGMGGRSIARWSNGAWTSLGTGANGPVFALARAVNGDVIAGGFFTTIAGVGTTAIARWNGATWSPLGIGLTGNSAWVAALTTLANGDLIAGGYFASAGGTPANNIARWNGTNWTALGSGTNSTITAVVAMPNGDVVAGGSFAYAGGVLVQGIARWNGTAWAPLGVGTTGTVTCLLALPNGDLIAGGSFGTARWNGTAWTSLGSGIGVGVVYALHLRPDGSVIAGGNFSTASGSVANAIARWDGSTWGPLGAGMTSISSPDAMVNALASMPNGDLIAGGRFDVAGGIAANNVARWDGATWATLGVATNATVYALLVQPAGELSVAGDFTSRYVSTCPATVSTQGTGCASSGGTNTLTATSLPWVDATFTARGAGLPNLAVVLALTSFTSIPQGVTPLASFFVQSPPGCDLLVGPDIVETLVTTNGVADSRLFLPNIPPLVGLPFFHQMVPVEVGPALDILSITATNALRLVAGDF